ncbi:MAG: methyltransferase domain-containing protein [Betaproteobacteria bacterium]
MLGSILKDLLRPGTAKPAAQSAVRRVLNVGGGSKTIRIPGHYDGWEQLLLDIDKRGGADIVCDARNLLTLPGTQFDAVYCSHNLEHYYPHDVVKVLAGFLHVLKLDGFTEIRVPDIQAVMHHVVQTGMDIDDVLYQSPAGPIAVHDVLYGYGIEIEASGQDYFAHKRGFTPKSLQRVLDDAGFAVTFVLAAPGAYEVMALAFKGEPTTEQRRALNLVPA